MAWVGHRQYVENKPSYFMLFKGILFNRFLVFLIWFGFVSPAFPPPPQSTLKYGRRMLWAEKSIKVSCCKLQTNSAMSKSISNSHKIGLASMLLMFLNYCTKNAQQRLSIQIFSSVRHFFKQTKMFHLQWALANSSYLPFWYKMDQSVPFLSITFRSPSDFQ